jgi:2-oxoglutarate dehydrogenase E1 component
LIAKHETTDIYTNKLLSEGVIDPTFVNGLEKEYKF